MKFKIYSPQFINSDHDVIIPCDDQSMSEYPVYMVCDDEIVATELYNYIVSSIKLDKNVTSEEFNDALDQALNTPEHRVKRCNLAVAIYNHGGCFVAQMGKTRVLQVRPATQEIEYDSRAQVLDIYSSKAKVELIKDLKADDYIMLCSAENIDEKAIRKALCNVDKDDHAKIDEVNRLVSKVKTVGGATPAVVLNHVEESSGSGASFSLSFLSGFKAKYLGYLLLIAVVVLLVVGAVKYLPDMFSGKGDTMVNPEVSISTTPSHDADVTYVKDSLLIKAEQDSLKRAALKADSLKKVQRLKADSIKAAKRRAAAAKKLDAAQNEEIKEVHAEPQPETKPASEQQPAATQPATTPAP